MPKPKAAGYIWRQKLVALVQDEKAEMPTLLRLMEVATTPATVAMIRGLIESKMERIDQLHELKSFRHEADCDSGEEG